MNPLQQLNTLGQSPWLDFISRSSVRGGRMRELMELGIVGVTSNPAIFEAAIVGSSDYDEAIRELGQAGRDAFGIYDQLSLEDVGEAADLFRPVYEKTDGLDGYVSLEVSPFLAADTKGTIAEGRRLWAALSRPNVMIKVPATREGIPAIEALIADGINVNVTLLFSLDRYRLAADAYIAGLRQRAFRGESLAVASVASFFVSRFDTLVDPSLPEEWRAKSAIALSQCAYGDWMEIFGEEFDDLREAGARTQRLLWASTSTKNPAYSPTLYVEALVGAETVNTLPMATVEACLAMDHAPVTVLPERVAEARAAVEQLRGLGVDFDQAAETLEREGVEKFVQPFEKLLKSVEEKRAAVLAGS